MLTSLHIRDFAVIEALELDFTGGLTVLTGETGAGKSVLMDALSLAVGGRGDVGIIRAGAESADVVAHFNIDRVPEVATWLEDQALASDDQCLLRRLLFREGRSKAFINGMPATIKQLGSLGDMLINLHQQAAHRQLASRTRQLAILDAFGDHNEQCTQVQKLYRCIESCRKRLQAIVERDDRQAVDRLALLDYQLDELASVDLDGFEEMNAEHERLAGAGASRQRLEQALQGLSTDDLNIISLLQRHSAELGQIEGTEAHLEAGRELLSTAAVHLTEAVAELAQSLDRMQEDPQRLHELEDYLTRIHDLARKHKVAPAGLAAFKLQLQQQRAQWQEDAASAETLANQLQQLEVSYDEQASVLSSARKKAAKAMSKAVSHYLSELGMAGGQFQVSVSDLLDQPLSTGTNAVTFQIAGGKGQPLAPLDKVASGGELSRISIAIQLVAVGAGLPPTMVFDEADAGIGGRTGEQVGLLLSKLAEQTQVICATHLPQVAVFGHQHLHAEKGAQQAGLSCVKPLSNKERRVEIARMLDGRASDKKSLAHAGEMLKRAAVS